MIRRVWRAWPRLLFVPPSLSPSLSPLSHLLVYLHFSANRKSPTTCKPPGTTEKICGRSWLRSRAREGDGGDGDGDEEEEEDESGCGAERPLILDTTTGVGDAGV